MIIMILNTVVDHSSYHITVLVDDDDDNIINDIGCIKLHSGYNHIDGHLRRKKTLINFLV